MTRDDNPHRVLELTQLVADLKFVVGPVLYTDEGFERVAEQLYARGVRSRLHAPRRTTDRIHFVSDPDTGRFTVTDPGEYELVTELDQPDVELRPLDLAPVRASQAPFYRLVKRADLSVAELSLLRFVGTRLPVRTDPDSGYTLSASGKLIRWSSGIIGVQLDPTARIVPALPMSEVPGHTQPVSAPGVPHPIPARPLPEAVYRVIQLVAKLKANSAWGSQYVITEVPEAGVLRVADLEAVLAEIPDVAPRYPTIWAYEQACRTIRERDDRITKALEKLEDERYPAMLDGDRRAAIWLEELQRILRLRMPRTEPATPEQLSEVTRALELAEQDVLEPVPAWTWVHAGRALAKEVQRLRHIVDQQGDLADAVFTDPDTGLLIPCGTCSALEPPVRKPAVGRSGRGWPRCAQHLVEDALDDAGLEKNVQRCPSCSHLASAHYDDGSGCSVTIRDVGLGAGNHCPCTFDARSVHRG